MISLARNKLNKIAPASRTDTVVEAQRAIIVAVARNPALHDDAVAIVQDVFGMLLTMVLLGMAAETGDAPSAAKFNRLAEQAVSCCTQLLDYVEGRPATVEMPVVLDNSKPSLEID
jgi:hypothetical protein